ncbi:MAG: nuclear transport factor 2 family protein [Maribacter sp.]|nr:nuclear transport factor 2 family protein [Maribacter sp.]
MKKLRYYLMVCTLSGLTLSAQTFNKSPESAEDSTQVVRVIEALSKAMVNRDSNSLENLTLDGMTYGHSSGKIETKDEFIDEVVNGLFDFISIEPSEQTIYVLDDTAVVRHIFNAQATNDGTPVTIRIGNMMVLKKQHDQWKILARQAYKL